MSAQDAEFGRVRWKRFAIVMIPSTIVAGLLLFATAEGAIAASFAVSGNVFKSSFKTLQGNGFVQFGAVDHEVNGTLHPVLVSAFRSARIADLCQSAKMGPFVLRITAGGGARKVTATNLVIDLASLADDASFTNIEIGRDASTLTDGPPGVVGAPGGFAEQSTTIHLTNVKETAWATTAGTFSLPELRVGFGSECF